MLSGGTCVVFLVISCVYASTVFSDGEHEQQDSTYYDDYFPRRDPKSEGKANPNYNRLLNYRGYGQEPQATIIVALIRPNTSTSEGNASTTSVQDEANYGDAVTPIWIKDEDTHDEYEDDSSEEDSFEDYDNPHRRQESGQYLYSYQSKPSFRTHHRTKHMWHHPPTEKYSSNVVGYSIQVQHPTLTPDQFNNEQPSYQEQFKTHSTDNFEKPLTYYDGSLDSNEKFKELIINFKNGFKDQDYFFNQFNKYKSHSDLPSERANIQYDFPEAQITNDDSNESPSDIEKFTSSPDFMALIKSLKSNQFIQMDESESARNYDSSGQNSDAPNIQVPLTSLRYNSHNEGTSHDLEDDASFVNSKNIEQDHSDNEAKIKTITFTENVPYPVKVEKQVPVPIKVPVDKPFPIFITKPVPVRVHKPVPVPVRVPVPKPFPVQKIIPIPVKIPIPRSFPVPVNKPYPVFYYKKVPFAVIRPRFYPIKIPVEKPVPYAVTYNKYVPVPIVKNVPVPVKVPKYQDKIKIEVEFEKPDKKTLEGVKTYANNFKYGHIGNGIKLPLHIPLDKVKEDYFQSHNEGFHNHDLNFDKETLALFSMNNNPKKVNPEITSDKEIFHNTNFNKFIKEPITLYSFNRYHDSPTTFLTNNENDLSLMTTAIFNNNQPPKNFGDFNPNFNKDIVQHSSNSEEVINKLPKAHFSMDFYPDKAEFSKGKEEHAYLVPNNNEDHSQYSHEVKDDHPKWSHMESYHSQKPHKVVSDQSQWTTHGEEDHPRWSHKEAYHPQKSHKEVKGQSQWTTYGEDEDHPQWSHKDAYHSQKPHKKVKDQSQWVPKEPKSHSQWRHKGTDEQSHWAGEEPETQPQWSHEESDDHTHTFSKNTEDYEYSYTKDIDDHTFEIPRDTKYRSRLVHKESDEQSFSVPKKSKEISYSFPKEPENYSKTVHSEEKEPSFSFSRTTKDKSHKYNSELNNKNKAFPRDYDDPKQFYVIKSSLSKSRSKELEKNNDEENIVVDDKEEFSLIPTENEFKPTLRYHDVLRVKSLRPSLHKIKITKLSSRKRPRLPYEERNSTFVDSNPEYSSSDSKVRVWRGSKRYKPEESFDHDYYDGRRYDSTSSSSQESSAYKPGETNGSNMKMSEPVTSEMKINSDKEEGDSKSGDGTRSSEASSPTRQSWSTNHSRRRNRHASKETPRENSTSSP